MVCKLSIYLGMQQFVSSNLPKIIHFFVICWLYSTQSTSALFYFNRNQLLANQSEISRRAVTQTSGIRRGNARGTYVHHIGLVSMLLSLPPREPAAASQLGSYYLKTIISFFQCFCVSDRSWSVQGHFPPRKWWRVFFPFWEEEGWLATENKRYWKC